MSKLTRAHLHAVEEGESEQGSPDSRHRFYLSDTFNPRNDTQKAYSKAIRDNDLVFAVGPAGTGKTHVPVWYGLDQLARNRTEKIIVVRPEVGRGKTQGFLPGNLFEKMQPWAIPVIDVMTKYIGYKLFQALEAEGSIELAPLCYMRGRTLESAVVIVDEAQNANPEEMEMLLTRFGQDTKYIVTGDPSQCDLKGPSGLTDAIDLLAPYFNRCASEEAPEGVRIKLLEFTDADNVRAPMSCFWSKQYATKKKGPAPS